MLIPKLKLNQDRQKNMVQYCHFVFVNYKACREISFKNMLVSQNQTKVCTVCTVQHEELFLFKR